MTLNLLSNRYFNTLIINTYEPKGRRKIGFSCHDSSTEEAEVSDEEEADLRGYL